MGNKAFFLDRDGTVIIDKGYLYKQEDIEFVQGIPNLLKKLKDLGYLLIVVSNQSGVARGYFPETTVQLINDVVNTRLSEEYGFTIDGFYYCPHHPEHGEEKYHTECDCRKPKPGMIWKAASDFDIDISKSVMVGDKESDCIDLDGLKCIRIEKDCDWSMDKRIRPYIDL